MGDADIVYLLFVDESGKPDERAFAVGGVVVRADEWPLLRDRWLAALDAHGWPADKELKWHGTRTGEVPPALAGEVFAAIAASPITCLVIVLKPLATRQRRPDLFGSPEDVYTQALMWLAERYQRFLARHDTYGVIVLDSRQPDLDNRLRRFFERLQRDGTPYVRLERIVDSLVLGPSHHSIGLQVADVVVASTLAGQRGLGDASRWHKQRCPDSTDTRTRASSTAWGWWSTHARRAARSRRRRSCSRSSSNVRRPGCAAPPRGRGRFVFCPGLRDPSCDPPVASG